MDTNSTSQLMIKRCRVCGDQAVCYNFNVLTCSPCRLFFYRNVSKIEKFNCATKGNCEINSSKRKYCRKCRLMKCFSVGMRPKLVTENLILLQENVIKLKNPFELNQIEKNYINELMQGSWSIFDFEERNLPVLYEETNPNRTLHLSMFYVRRVIKYCKSYYAFRSSLNISEQLKVLKQFTQQFLSIRYAFTYDSEIGGFYSIGNEQANSSVLIQLNKPSQMSDIKLNIKSNNNNKKWKKHLLLKMEMDDDTIIRELLIVQALFSFTNKNVSNQESLRYHYCLYNRLLLRYLQCKLKNMEKAENKYSTLIRIANDLKFCVDVLC